MTYLPLTYPLPTPAPYPYPCPLPLPLPIPHPHPRPNPYRYPVGLFTVAGIVDASLYHSSKKLKKMREGRQD